MRPGADPGMSVVAQEAWGVLTLLLGLQRVHSLPLVWTAMMLVSRLFMFLMKALLRAWAAGSCRRGSKCQQAQQGRSGSVQGLRLVNDHKAGVL